MKQAVVDQHRDRVIVVLKASSGRATTGPLSPIKIGLVTPVGFGVALPLAGLKCDQRDHRQLALGNCA
jgi:hypothetical protein